MVVLLRGHVYCRQCGRLFHGLGSTNRIKGERWVRWRYRCTGKLSLVSPTVRCQNKSWLADKIDTLVWEQIEQVLKRPEIIISEIEKQRQEANQLSVLETELHHVERQLKMLDREQEQLLQWALKGFPEETVLGENKKINAKRESLKAQKAELEAQVKSGKEAAVSLPKLEELVQRIQEKLATPDFQTKRMAIDMLNIKVWLDGDNVEITGAIPIEEGLIATTQS